MRDNKMFHYSIKHKIKEGVKIRGNGISIDVIVRNISGRSRFTREADIDLIDRTSKEKTSLHLRHDDKPYMVTNDISMRMGVNNTRSGGKLVYIFYETTAGKYGFYKSKFD